MAKAVDLQTKSAVVHIGPDMAVPVPFVPLARHERHGSRGLRCPGLDGRRCGVRVAKLQTPIRSQVLARHPLHLLAGVLFSVAPMIDSMLEAVELHEVVDRCTTSSSLLLEALHNLLARFTATILLPAPACGVGRVVSAEDPTRSVTGDPIRNFWVYKSVDVRLDRST